MDSVVAREMLLRHFLAERDRDVDATMATVSAHPSWRLPNGRVEGRDAGRALYERLLPLLPEGWPDENIRALDDSLITHWGDAHCVIEYSDEYSMHRGWVMVVHFDDHGMIRSENAYPPPGSSLPTDHGADFESLPGVVRRNEAPTERGSSSGPASDG
jgi:hypothetical protein